MAAFSKEKLLHIFSSFSSSAPVLFIKKHKKALSVTIILLFFGFFGYYIVANPSVLTSIAQVGPLVGVSVLVLYFVVLLTNVALMHITIRLHQKEMPLRQNILLVIYSSLVNFFGPLQSGPGVRAVYLKAKIGLRIRDYTYATLVYYLAFGILNLSLLFITVSVWITLVGFVTAALLTLLASRFFRSPKRRVYALGIFIATLIQVILMVCIYTLELQAVSTTTLTLLQTASYTGSANLSLFVSLTPGGIGVREAFLVFTQSLHQVQLSSIVASGIIDRALYILLLGILFVISSSMHLGQLFSSKKTS
jgi:uncharacterized membrane protein YbhN (UPF0104 family)